MIKIFTLLNVAGLFLFNLLFVGDVGIVQEMPSKMDPGTEVRVTVTINKDKISGFAKLQIDLPEGLTASAIETKGASFTFADGKVKFIWMALPTQPSFKVSYTLSADASASGPMVVTGRLSYIEDNERKTLDMASSTITIGTGGAVTNTPSVAKAQPVDSDADNTIMDDRSASMSAPMGGITGGVDQSLIPDIAGIDATGTSPQGGPGNVSASRTITPVSNSEMLVEVTIKKGLLRGFGKLQETLPEGFTAVSKATDDAIFSTKGRVAKFVWLNLPSKEEMKVTYRLIAPSTASGELAVNGEFGYLLNDLTQRAVVGTTNFTLGGTVADNTPVKAPMTTPPATTTSATPPPQAKSTPEPTVTKSTRTEPSTDVVAARPSKAKAISTPAPEAGITYKVQITAAHREVGKPYFVQRHHYDGDFSIERNDGWIKYVTGMFDGYRAARDQRQAYLDAKYNFPGPFVTAYNNGERITVQEALMIAKQSPAQ